MLFLMFLVTENMKVFNKTFEATSFVGRYSLSIKSTFYPGKYILFSDFS